MTRAVSELDTTDRWLLWQRSKRRGTTLRRLAYDFDITCADAAEIIREETERNRS